MPPFRFRFDSLLQIRCRVRDDAGMQLGKAEEAIRMVDEQIATLQEQRDQIRQSTAVVMGTPGTSGVADLSVDTMLRQGRYDLMLQADQMSLRQTRQQLEIERDRRREALVVAEAEVKQLEKLRETRQAEHHLTQSRVEQAEADDLTTARRVIAARAIEKRRRTQN